MLRFLLGFLLLIATFADAETLRISMVRETAGEDAERMVLHFEAGGQPKEEVVFVRREIVVGDADVARVQIKARRENAGIFYLESIPTKEELDAMLLKGMRPDEVIAVLGKPSMSVGKAEDAAFRLAYEFAPEKRAENLEGVMLKNGFHVLFSGGKLTGWDFSHSNQPPERKVVGQVPGLLAASIPEVDLGAGEVDLVAYVESIKIPDIRQKVNDTDLYGLLSLVTMISTINQEKEERSVSAGCDVLKILAVHFSEVEGLAAKSVDGRIVIRKLESVLSPYVKGVKPLPEMKAEPSGVR